jgi:sugar phosphate isomerase/epimerase
MAFDRRTFLKTASVNAIGTGAILIGSLPKQRAPDSFVYGEPLKDDDRHRYRLASAAYSFRPHFGFFKGKVQEPKGDRSINMFEFIDYCAEHGCGAELTSYFFPPDADKAYFQRIKRYAFRNGVPIVGTAIGNNFTIAKGETLTRQINDAKRWIDRAVQMGAPHIRFFAGKKKELEASPETMAIAIESLQDSVEYAAKAGVFIGVENHGGLNAEDVNQIVDAIDNEWFGISLDSGNFVSEDPYEEIANCAPHAINVQIKVAMKSPDGEKYDADLDRIAEILRNANYGGNVVLEYEEADPFENVPAAMDQMRKSFS